MIKLNRRKNHKWIFQKNISSTDIMSEFITAANKYNNTANKEMLLTEFKSKDIYRGRTVQGSSNTMGVRTSQMKFYMFGYSLPSKSQNAFFPSPMSSSILKNSTDENIAKMSLVNLFSLQFPHPFSETPECFKIYAGRLIIKLLLEERLSNKLYIDEFCYFLPFLERIYEDIYQELIESILEFRNFSYMEKSNLFKSVANYNDVFANVMHEINYYFVRIFKGLKVLNVVGDKNHNEGKLHCFIHGASTKRNDGYMPRAKYSGYVTLSDGVIKYAKILNDLYSCFEKPSTMQDDDVLSKEDFILELYQWKPLKYLASIDSKKYGRNKEVSEVISNMVHMSKYGSKDGKDFENSLKPVFELFKQTENVEIISGRGDTDLLCAMRGSDDKIYKINVDGKTSSKATSQLNASRLKKHINMHNSRYCIVVSSRFSSGVSDDISESNIVAINAETLANYCINEYNSSGDDYIDYSLLEEFITSNLGSNITDIVQDFVNTHYGQM